jgi:uncharacterized protein (DUF302 family)
MERLISKTLVCDDIDECVACVVELLDQEGFKVASQTALATVPSLASEANAKQHRILNVCDPALAKELLSIDGKFGALAFCNVIVHETKSGCFEVVAADPLDNAAFEELADQCLLLDRMRDNLTRAIDRL